MTKLDKFTISAIIVFLGLFFLFIIAGSLAIPYEPHYSKADVDLLMRDLERARQQLTTNDSVLVANHRVVFDPASLYESPKLW